MREIIIKRYEGNCPECGKKQQSENKNNVDILCSDCKDMRDYLERERVKKEFNDNVIGAEVLIFNLLEKRIMVKCKNHKIYEIQANGWAADYQIKEIPLDSYQLRW